MPRLGGCRRGQVRCRVSALPQVTMACHCRNCQRMTASAFSLSALVPRDAFAVTDGEPMIGGVHGPTRHFHCPRCASWLFTEPDGLGGHVNLRATMLDEPGDWVTPFVEVHTDQKLRWAATPAKHRYATIPDNDVWERLIAGYRAQGRA